MQVELESTTLDLICLSNMAELMPNKLTGNKGCTSNLPLDLHRFGESIWSWQFVKKNSINSRLRTRRPHCFKVHSPNGFRVFTLPSCCPVQQSQFLHVSTVYSSAHDLKVLQKTSRHQTTCQVETSFGSCVLTLEHNEGRGI